LGAVFRDGTQPCLRILALSDEELATKYRNYVKQQEENVRQQDREVCEATRLYE